MDTDLIDEIVEKSEYSNVTKTPISTPSSVVTEAELERLRHLEVLFKTTERTAKIGYYEWNYEKDRLETCSEEYARIFGMSLEQIMEAHSNWDKVVTQVHPEDRELFVKSNDEMREHHHFDMEYRINLDNGEIRYLREICVSIIDGMDFVKINFGIIQDITEQKIAEQKIIAAKETLEQQVIERTRDLADTVKQLEEEITERKKVSAELQFLANHDALTGLPSLRLGKDRVQ